MTTIIARLYAAGEKAAAAVDALKRRGYASDEVYLVTPTSGAIEALVVKGGVRESDAAAYAEKIRRGNSLVTVHAPFGSALKTTKLLESFGPVDAGSEYHYTPTYYDPTPLSDFLGLPVLAESKSPTELLDNPTPCSSLFGLPVLSKSKPFSSLTSDDRPWSKLVSDDRPWSGLVKDDRPSSKLSRNPTPFSSFFGLPVLLKD